MKPLPEQFSFDGCQLRQLARDGDVVLLERTKRGICLSTYEVAIVQHHAAVVIHGRAYSERESMPPSASWGSYGWSYAELASARKKFNELVAGRSKPYLSLTPFPASAPEGF
jgi:hypothetical protein